MVVIRLILVVVSAAAVSGAYYLETHAPPQDAAARSDPFRRSDGGTANAAPAAAKMSPLSRHLVCEVPIDDFSLAAWDASIGRARAEHMQAFFETGNPRFITLPDWMEQADAKVRSLQNSVPLFSVRAVPHALTASEAYITQDGYADAKQAYQLLTVGEPSVPAQLDQVHAAMRARQKAFGSLRSALVPALLDGKVPQRGHDLWCILVEDRQLAASVRDPSVLQVERQRYKIEALTKDFEQKLLAQRLTNIDVEKVRHTHEWCLFAIEELGRVHSAMDDLTDELSRSEDTALSKAAAAIPRKRTIDVDSNRPRPFGSHTREYLEQFNSRKF